MLGSYQEASQLGASGLVLSSIELVGWLSPKKINFKPFYWILTTLNNNLLSLLLYTPKWNRSLSVKQPDTTEHSCKENIIL
jgi:hypothetical protein